MNLVRKNSCRIQNLALSIAIIIIMVTIAGVIALSVNVPWFFTYQTDPEFWAIFIGSTVAIANAILLFVTLRAQNEGIANEKYAHRQERFETTFFNLLESQRRLTEEISIESCTLDEEGNLIPQKVSGRSFFLFAANELRFITQTLNSDIEEKYDVDTTSKAFEAFEDEWKSGEKSETEIHNVKKTLISRLRIEYYNLLYNINENCRKDYISNKNLPYILLKEKWYGCFEHYIRNLYYILDFVNQETKTDEECKKKYIRFVQSQMSRAELNLVETHAMVFPLFRKMLDKTHLNETVINKV